MRRRNSYSCIHTYTLVYVYIFIAKNICCQKMLHLRCAFNVILSAYLFFCFSFKFIYFNFFLNFYLHILFHFFFVPLIFRQRVILKFHVTQASVHSQVLVNIQVNMCARIHIHAYIYLQILPH